VRPAADLVLGHPANAGLRRHREPGHQRPGLAALAFPEMVARPYESLGTHPDLVARLWDELGRAASGAAVRGAEDHALPARTGIRFESHRDDWVFCGWYKDEGSWCRAAYDYAGRAD